MSREGRAQEPPSWLMELAHTKLIGGKQADDFSGWRRLWLFGLQSCVELHCSEQRLTRWDSNVSTSGGVITLAPSDLGENEVTVDLCHKSCLRDWYDDGEQFNRLHSSIKLSRFVSLDCMFLHLFAHNEHFGNEDDSSEAGCPLKWDCFD